jgi:predicted enzyme related to lactoylglutathione lyase
VPLSLFAGICVRDYKSAVEWYERFFGREATFEAHATECVWELAEGKSVFVLEDEERAGNATHTMLVADVEKLVGEISERGIEPAETETYSNGVTKVTYRDPDGNEVGYAEEPRE